MKKILVFITLLLSIIVTTSSKNLKAYGDLDYIHEYIVQVNPRKDGTLDLQVYLKWEVIDSSSEGPLSWIRVGVPNCYVDEFRILSSSISKIDYMYDAGASVIRVDLNRNYHAGEIVEIKYAFHLSRMYHLSSDLCVFDYSPGWFDEIKVGKMKVYWNKDNVIRSNTNKSNDEYLIWEYTNLNYKETIKVNVTYNQSSFVNLSEELQYTDQAMTNTMKIIAAVIVTLIIAFIITIIVIAYLRRDPYLEHRGFCTSYRWYHFHHHHRYRPNSGVNKKGHVIVNPTSISSGSHSSGSSCACACACACAGGGRAGCSRKDFYNTKIDTDKIIEKLK